MNEYQKKLRSLGFSLKRGTPNRVPVINEETGRVGGYQTTHWDDHQDAEVIPEPVRATFGKEEE